MYLLNNKGLSGNEIWIIDVDAPSFSSDIKLGVLRTDIRISNPRLGIRQPLELLVEDDQLLAIDTYSNQNRSSEIIGGWVWEIDPYDKNSSNQLDYSGDAYLAFGAYQFGGLGGI